MARPRKPVDVETLKKLAAIHCTNEEIASVLGVSKDTLERRFATEIREGRDHGKISLKRKQYEMAIGGNTTMLVWLGKQHLKQTDRAAHEVSGPNGRPIETKDMSGLTDEQVDARIAMLMPKGEGA